MCNKAGIRKSGTENVVTFLIKDCYEFWHEMAILKQFSFPPEGVIKCKAKAFAAWKQFLDFEYGIHNSRIFDKPAICLRQD